MPDQAGLRILKRFLTYERNNQARISLEMFLRPWNNASGQLSLLVQCLLNPDANIIAQTSTPHIDALNLGAEEATSIIHLWHVISFIIHFKYYT